MPEGVFPARALGEKGAGVGFIIGVLIDLVPFHLGPSQGVHHVHADERDGVFVATPVFETAVVVLQTLQVEKVFLPCLISFAVMDFLVIPRLRRRWDR